MIYMKSIMVPQSYFIFKVFYQYDEVFGNWSRYVQSFLLSSDHPQPGFRSRYVEHSQAVAKIIETLAKFSQLFIQNILRFY